MKVEGVGQNPLWAMCLIKDWYSSYTNRLKDRNYMITLLYTEKAFYWAYFHDKRPREPRDIRDILNIIKAICRKPTISIKPNREK